MIAYCSTITQTCKYKTLNHKITVLDLSAQGEIEHFIFALDCSSWDFQVSLLFISAALVLNTGNTTAMDKNKVFLCTSL